MAHDSPSQVSAGSPPFGGGTTQARPKPLPRGAKALLSVLALVGCDRPQQVALTDTEGRAFRAVCPEGQGCTIEQAAGSREPGSPMLHSAGRLVGVCRSSIGEPVLATCRALTCDREADCPPAHGMEHGTCIGGLCVEPSQELATADAVMLCLSGTGPQLGKPIQVERYAMALNCGTPCRVPASCRQLQP